MIGFLNAPSIIVSQITWETGGSRKKIRHLPDFFMIDLIHFKKQLLHTIKPLLHQALLNFIFGFKIGNDGGQ